MSWELQMNSQVFEFNESYCDLIITLIPLLSIFCIEILKKYNKKLISIQIIVVFYRVNYCSFINKERLIMIN